MSKYDTCIKIFIVGLDSFSDQDFSLLLFAITAAGVVPCGDPKKSPRTSSIVQIIFSFWSFEISEDILRFQKFITGLDSISNQCFIYLAPFGNY